MINQYSIRPLMYSDLAAVNQLDYMENPDPWGAQLISETFQQLKQTNSENVQKRHHWGIEIGDSGLCGFLCSSVLLDEAELELIVIAKASRRQGFAKALMFEWCEFLRESLVTNAMLEVRESNVGAMNLYQQLGFKPVGMRKNYYRSQRSDGESRESAILMTLQLNNAE